MTNPIERLAERYHGRVDEKSDAIIVLFNNPAEARECAEELECSTQHKVSLCGCAITIEAERFLEQLRCAGL